MTLYVSRRVARLIRLTEFYPAAFVSQPTSNVFWLIRIKFIEFKLFGSELTALFLAEVRTSVPQLCAHIMGQHARRRNMVNMGAMYL
jgi:hypothetical protein